MRRVLESSIKAGESTIRSAERLLDADIPAVELPKYVRELSKAAKFPRGYGDKNEYERVVKRFKSQINRLGQGAEKAAGEYTVRSAAQQMIKDLRRAQPDQVDGIVNRWVLERARYQARVMARHEAVEAARDVQLNGYREQPWVVGVRWTLSGAHPKFDVCDCHAGADIYGLGPGGYPKDQVPDRHTSCLCGLVPISDNAYLRRETARLRDQPEPPRPWETEGGQSPEDWLRAQSRETRRAILGPTRAKLVEQGRKVLDEGASNFRPVYQLKGMPRPRIERGPRVDASQIVKADRQTMVRPFPDLPRR